MRIRVFGFQFQPAPWSSVAMVIFVSATFALGEWQTRRAAEKLNLQNRQEKAESAQIVPLPASVISVGEYDRRMVEVRGTFVPERTIYLDNRVYKKQAGYQLLTPMRIGQSNQHVVVNRGWIAIGTGRESLPIVPVPAGEQIIRGVASIPRDRVYELAKDTAHGPVRQNVVLDRLRDEWGVSLQPIILLQTSAVNDGLIRDWPRPDSGANTHLAYAFQWYVMALMGLIIWLVLNTSRSNGQK